jgi:hypothetical protein
LSISATHRLVQMNQGLAGSSNGCPGRMIMG